jgi:DNA mismatch repair protein MutL
MSRIRILDDATINQIAAGEVVERPSSVVKELVENAIDAGATRISISLKDGGKSYIQIKDNGSGMAREDALLSFEKHATSKIRDIQDIFTIRSLGFRGEALSSITSVSQTTLVTRAAPGTLDTENYAGTRLVIEGGEVKKAEEIGCPAGTTITVENLFFNIPARLKYLKSDRTELNHILAVVNARTLAYPEIFFELTHEGRRLILSPGSSNLLETISAIIGKSAARQMVELNYVGPKAEVRGYLSKPSHTRANQRHIFLFINRGPVRSPNIIRAIREGFGSLLPQLRYPVGVLELFVDPKELDVNIHPMKSEVKFQYPDDIFSSVVNAIKYALGGKDLSVRSSPGKARSKKGETGVREFFTDAEKRRMAVAEGKVPYSPDVVPSSISFPPPSPPHIPSTQPTQISKKATGLITEKQARIDVPSMGITEPESMSRIEAQGTSLENALPRMRPIGQVGKLFIIVETLEGFAVIDQHAAHERIMYERFKGDHREEPVKSQQLIEPLSLELAPEEQEAVRDYQSLLKFMGFEIEAFGGNTFIVRTVPVVLGKHTTPETIYDIIDELVATGKSRNLEEQKDDMLKLLACHSAIRGGEELSMPRIEGLLEELLTMENPFTCPHGRPTIIQFPTKELEKKFKRTGF